MNITVIVRTRDEEDRIGPFCEAYSWATNILVADGGSEDRTIAIAMRYPNVRLRAFTERTAMDNALWRNNDSRHINFLIEWAEELRPDWVIMDDCDMRPNYLLRKEGRSIIENCDRNVIMAVRLYLWGTTEHFPHMAKPGDGHEKWEPSLWAWRPSIQLRTIDLPPAYNLSLAGVQVGDLHASTTCLDLLPPHCLLHFSWDDPDRTQRKVDFYRASGLIREMRHPLEFAGPREPLPEWAREQ